MRSKEAIKNTICSIISYSIIVIIGFIAQRVFIQTLGNEYLGIHSLFSNIVTMLGIIELGFGSAIITNLYKPVAEKDYLLINNLLNFYKRVYRYVAVIVFIIGILLLLFIDKIVGDTTLNINFKFIFMFYLIDTVASYLLSYKRSIIYANQKAYYINSVHTIITLIMNIIQILILIYTKNYYLYLATKISCRILENIVINKIVDLKYPFVKEKNYTSLNKDLKEDIVKKVKGLLFHKIGTFVVCGTDNIMISMLPGLGIVWVGLYSNYLLITNQLSNIINQIFNSIIASVGNLVIEENYEKNYSVFKSILLANAWIYTYVSISFYFLSKPFISLWLGEKYLFENYIVLALVLSFYVNGMRKPYSLFKEAAGIFYEDRLVPIIESIVNLIISLIAGYYFGILGVFIGTICSNLVLFLYSFPKYVYIQIFKRKINEYFRDIIIYLIIFLLVFTICYWINLKISFNNFILELIIKGVIIFIICNFVFIITKRKTNEFKYFYKMFLKIIKK